jgi:bifunctional polynucleotide phosphatase/kinase
MYPDNTNADETVRADWVSLAQKRKVPIRCILFKTPIAVAEHNAAVRASSILAELNPESRQVLPKLAFTTFASRYRPPKLKEGFEDIVEVKFQFRGSKAEYEVWGRYTI